MMTRLTFLTTSCLGLWALALSCSEPFKPLERGPEWVVFRTPGAPLRSNRVNDITAHGNSQMWIATDIGAAYFEHGSWGVIEDSLRYTMYSTEGSWVEARVNCIAIGKDGSVWFGLGGGGIRRYRQNAESGSPWSRYESPTITYNSISSIACENVTNGDVWASTFASGLNRFIPSAADPRFGTWFEYTTSNVPEFGTNILEAVEVNPTDRSVWVATLVGLTVFASDLSGWTRINIPPPYNYIPVAIDFDDAGRVWMGKVQGASMFDPGSGVWSHYTSTNTNGALVQGTRVNAVETRGNNLRWFGTNDGLVKYQDTSWTVYNRATLKILPSDSVTALSYDKRGNLWIGTRQGIVVHNPAGTVF